MSSRTWKIAGTVTSAATVDMSGEPVSGSNAWTYRGVWGIMPAASAAGTVTMAGGGSVNLAHIATGTIFPCHPSVISASAGTVYLLA